MNEVFQVQDLSQFKLAAGFRGKPGWYVQLWWITQDLLFHTSPQFLYGWRRFLLRLFGAKIGAKVIIRPSVKVTFPWRLSVGAHTWIGDNVVLYSLDKIEIGENAVISQGTYLCTGSHDYESVEFTMVTKPIFIEPEVWIAAQVFVAPGVRIGRGAVIGARSLLLRDVGDMMVATGSPATVVRKRGVSNYGRSMPPTGPGKQ